MIDSSVKCSDKPETLGWKIICSIIASFGRKTWIPVEYIIEKPKEFKAWIDSVMELRKAYDEKTVMFINAAILKMMALQPSGTDSIWPSKVVADVIENIAGTKLEEQKNAASSFASGKTNSLGARCVGDGTVELEQYKKYTGFAESYRATHPTTALALEYIAGSYKRDADMDKQRAIIGWF